MSEPSPIGAKPAPMAEPSPPDEPPAVRLGSYALLVRPYSRFDDSIHIVASDVFVTPIGIAPAARNRASAGASACALPSARCTSPAAFGIPATATDSFTVQGIASK